jgi:crotonobetainyl-CoA:carnitine CoA-transferase CaiB-like acyl-CoA transferase
MVTQPLKGLRVVELSHMVMAPSCGLVLADLGADVIKVEPPGGDKTRRLGGSGAGFFPAFNRNKRSLMVDLKSREGRQLTRRLVADADILIENFRPGALAGYGLDYETVSAAHPRLVYCSLKGFLSGPYEHRVALDEVVQMMGGLAYMTGPPGRPLRAGTSINDIMGGVFGVVGILAAIHERSRTGRGQLVRAALFENNAFLVAQHIAQYAASGVPAAPMPARLSAWAVYDVFETMEGSQLFVGVVTDTQWTAFCEAFALSDLQGDPALRSNEQRVAARDGFMPRLRHLFLNMPIADAMARCERIGLPFAPIFRPEDLLDDPHLAAGDGMLDIAVAAGRRTRLPSLPLEMSGQRPSLRHDVPTPGADTAAIAGELGYSSSELAELFGSGILSGPRSKPTTEPEAL